MTKFIGKIGFVKTVETSPGVWEETVLDVRNYRGDIVREGRRIERGDNLNSEFVVNNYVSVVADKFAYDNFQYMRWVEVSNSKWKISSVEIEYPRLKITLGGVWRGL